MNINKPCDPALLLLDFELRDMITYVPTKRKRKRREEKRGEEGKEGRGEGRNRVGSGVGDVTGKTGGTLVFTIHSDTSGPYTHLLLFGGWVSRFF